MDGAFPRKREETIHAEDLQVDGERAWINIIDPTPYELKVVSNLTEVDPDFLRSALDDEERSHTDVEDDSVMVLTNVPVCRDKDSYDALPLAIIVTDEFILTVCLEETPVISEFN